MKNFSCKSYHVGCICNWIGHSAKPWPSNALSRKLLCSWWWNWCGGGGGGGGGGYSTGIWGVQSTQRNPDPVQDFATLCLGKSAVIFYPDLDWTKLTIIIWVLERLTVAPKIGFLLRLCLLCPLFLFLCLWCGSAYEYVAISSEKGGWKYSTYSKYSVALITVWLIQPLSPSPWSLHHHHHDHCHHHHHHHCHLLIVILITSPDTRIDLSSVQQRTTTGPVRDNKPDDQDQKIRGR